LVPSQSLLDETVLFSIINFGYGRLNADFSANSRDEHLLDFVLLWNRVEVRLPDKLLAALSRIASSKIEERSLVRLYPRIQPILPPSPPQLALRIFFAPAGSDTPGRGPVTIISSGLATLLS
jgi:hypothetical protein